MKDSSHTSGVLGGNTQDSASLSPGLEERLKTFGSLDKIYDRIEGPLYYPAAFLSHRVQGTVRVKVQLDRFGRLLRIFPDTWSGDARLRGWVAKVLRQALKEPFLRQPLEATLGVWLNFHFQIEQHASLFSPAFENQHDSLHFHLQQIVPAKYDLTTGAFAVSLYQDIFGREKYRRDTATDGEMELETYQEACDKRRAGEIFAELGELDSAKKYFKKGCDLEYDKSCEKLAGF